MTENTREFGWYWVKTGINAWEPYQWTQKGWTSGHAPSYWSDDDDLGEIGPFIPYPSPSPREEHTIAQKLKPLVWEDRFETSYAESIFGLYSVWEISGSSYLRGPKEYGGKKVGATIGDAKEAAVRDIEEKISKAYI